MRSSVRVKICGITNLDDALVAVDAGADMLGFNFYPRSPRYVAPAAVADIVAQLPSSVLTVGVFVDEPREKVKDTADEAAVRALQFHGGESPAFCRGWARPIIKAIRVRDAHTVVEARAYDVDFILVDAYVDGLLGGTGTRVACELLQGFDRERLIVAGGLTADTVAEVVQRLAPYAVDVASGVERAPGRKDRELMRRFIANVHAT